MEPPTAAPTPGPFGPPAAPTELPAGARCAWHAETAASFVCARCGNYGCGECQYFLRDSRAVCRTCGPREAIPWERRRELGLWRAFWDTTRLASRRPTEFFRTPALESGAAAPVAYGAAAYTVGQILYAVELVILGVIVGVVFAVVVPTEGSGPGGGTLALIVVGIGVLYGAILVAATIFQAPIYALMGVFVVGGLSHLTLVLARKQTAPFEQTLRTVSYANAAHVWNAVPLFGPLVVLVAVVVVETIGLREAHKTSTGVALFAALVPRIVFFGSIVALYALIALFAFGTAALGAR